MTTVPACSSDTLTNVLPHRNAMPQTQDMTPYRTVYRHGADLSLCYLLMWNVTLEYTATHFNVLGETRPGNPSPTFHTQQRTLNLMVVNSWKLSRKYRTNRVLNPGPVVCESTTLSARPQRLPAMQGGSLYHFYDGLWYDPAERRTHDLPCERLTRYRLRQPDTVIYSFGPPSP